MKRWPTEPVAPRTPGMIVNGVVSRRERGGLTAFLGGQLRHCVMVMMKNEGRK